MLRLKDKIILVTGGAAGIGKAVVIKCLEEGAKVAFCDITDKAANEKLVAAIEARFSGLDGLVNNARASILKSLDATKESAYRGIQILIKKLVPTALHDIIKRGLENRRDNSWGGAASIRPMAMVLIGCLTKWKRFWVWKRKS